jgi:hypothetical protein
MAAANPLDENRAHHHILKLLSGLQCAECGARFSPHSFVLVHRWQDSWVLRTDCESCDTSSLVVVAMVDATEPEAMVDLSSEEVEETATRSPITSDDVLDMHLFLQELEGDLTPFIQ